MSALAKEGRRPLVLHVGSDDQGRFGGYASEAACNPEVLPTSLGRVTPERLSDLYASARYLVFPSHYEGFGLPVVEAQAHGLPVIASDIPVLREVAGDGAIFVPEGDHLALARAMKCLTDDDSLFFDLSERARINAARFSWDKAAQETSELLRQCIRH
jgi:glycosyltransferase involved in cell wall biosynthesis